MTKKIGPCLAAAVMTLHTLGECKRWDQFAMVGRYNAMRHMKKRGLVEDANAIARAADPDRTYRTHPARWRLTEAGRELAKKLAAD